MPEGHTQTDVVSVVVSDLHLNAKDRPYTGAALARVLALHPGAELILNGDIFELTMFPGRIPPSEALSVVLAANKAFCDALKAHLARGSSVTFLAGNHDAAVVELEPVLNQALGPVSVEPWFVQRGSVHVEHGHVYDPDNAPLHPLADFDVRAEPLGTALMRRFIAERGAIEFAHAHETTPVQGVRRAFALYGPRAPGLIANYFGTALSLCVEAATTRAGQRRRAVRVGAERLDAWVEQGVLTRMTKEALLAARSEPTHAHFASTFARLYLDAVLSGVVGCSALVRAALVGGGFSPLGLAAASAGYLLLSRPSSRYRQRPVRELRRAAEAVAAACSATTVVFGHTHVEEDSGRYFNLGSFTYCKEGHPFATIGRDNRVTRAYMPRS